MLDGTAVSERSSSRGSVSRIASCSGVAAGKVVGSVGNGLILFRFCPVSSDVACGFGVSVKAAGVLCSFLAR